MGAARLLSPLGTQAEIKAHGFSLLCVDERPRKRVPAASGDMLFSFTQILTLLEAPHP